MVKVADLFCDEARLASSDEEEFSDGCGLSDYADSDSDPTQFIVDDEEEDEGCDADKDETPQMSYIRRQQAEVKKEGNINI